MSRRGRAGQRWQGRAAAARQRDRQQGDRQHSAATLDGRATAGQDDDNMHL